MMFNKPVGCAFLVEDNPDDVAIFEYAARRMDFPITLSKHKTGTSALAEIADFVNRTEEQLPSLYILDISLSDMQGDVIFDSIAQAYRNLELDLPPIMFLTSAETPAAAHRVRNNAKARLCHKPTSLDGYSDVLKQMFELATTDQTVH
ncbi:MAG: hypothetical protein AAF737_03320 [Pseudomonadota bacterium]